MKKYLFAATAASFVLFSCQKDDDNSLHQPETTPDPAEYYPMNPGSYWIYENYKIDTNGTETAMNTQDSVYIAGDTTINGNEYRVMKSSGASICFNRSLRDSSGYLVDPSHYIHFAPEDFRDSLMLRTSAPFDEIARMQQVNQPVSVAAGSFEVLMLRRSIHINGSGTQRELREYRARNVGTVIIQYGTVHDPATYESRLVRYHIE